MLEELLYDIDYQLIQGNLQQEISHIAYDSRNVKDHTLFVCIRGLKKDGHDFIDQAIEKGATVIVVEKEVVYDKTITYIKVKDTRIALALLSCAYYHHPSHQMIVIGVTGTKGKTTTSFMIETILRKAKYKVGMIGTIGTYINGKFYQTMNTTPESYVIQKIMRKMVDEGCQYCVMEVSSQGLMLHRVTGIDFDYGVFTNLSSDHIGEGEHRSFEHYMECKKKLFHMCKIGIFNHDDPHSLSIRQSTNCLAKTFGFHEDSDLYVDHFIPITYQQKLGVCFDTLGENNMSIFLSLPGKFNIYNALAAILVCFCLKIEPTYIQEGLQKVCIPGRLEFVNTPLPCTVIIDYAHNPLAYENLFQMLKDYHPSHIYCVYGAGGHRDRQRRYEVGKIVAQNHAFSIVTADNPRGEDVLQICADIVQGIRVYNGEYRVIVDRKQAIHYALKHADEGDFILCLGKGHENYQIIDQVPLSFSERQIIEEYFI